MRAISGKGGEKSYHKKLQKINWVGRREGKRVKRTSQRLMGEHRGRKEEFLAVWPLSALTGLKCLKQPPLEPPPTYPLPMVHELHFGSLPGTLPCLS